MFSVMPQDKFKPYLLLTKRKASSGFLLWCYYQIRCHLGDAGVYGEIKPSIVLCTYLISHNVYLGFEADWEYILVSCQKSFYNNKLVYFWE